MRGIRTPRRARLAGTLAVLAGLAAGAQVVTAPAAGAAEVYSVPGSRVFDVEGHGFGHGRGMSQWGAQGGALQGASSQRILDGYYWGTVSTSIPEAQPLRVVLTREGAEGRLPSGSISTDRRYECDSSGPRACDLQVLPAAGLQVRAGSGADQTLPDSVPVPGGSARVDTWGVVNDAAGLRLRAFAAGAWRDQPLDGAATQPGPVTFSGPPTVRMQYMDLSVREYWGSLQAVRTSSTTMARVNVVRRENYLGSVVPKEMPASWQPAALEAQAVAARTYAEQYRRSRPAGAVWDICDSTYCQVYSGHSIAARAGATPVVQSSPRSDAAVVATSDLVRTYQGQPIRAEFSASSGGWTASGGTPWLPAQADGWDAVPGNPNNRWTGSLPASVLEQRWPAVGRLTAVAVLSRDGNGEWGGRIGDVELRGVAPDGSPTTVRTTGDALRSAYAYSGGNPSGLRSTWFVLRTPAQVQLTGAWAGPTGLQLAWGRPDTSVVVGRVVNDVVVDKAELGGVFLSGPVVVGRASGWLEVFARGRDDQLYTNRRTPEGSWLGWQSLGGRIRATPAIAANGEELTMLVLGDDGQLWHRWSWAPGAWSDWSPIGGAVAPGSIPAAVYRGPSRLDAVVLNPDGRLWRRTYDRGWQAWQPVPDGTFAGGATAASADGELTVVGLGHDTAGWTRTDSTPWTSLGGNLPGPPTAAARLGSGRVDVVTYGFDGAFWTTTRTGGAWSGWRRLG